MAEDIADISVEGADEGNKLQEEVKDIKDDIQDAKNAAINGNGLTETENGNVDTEKDINAKNVLGINLPQDEGGDNDKDNDADKTGYVTEDVEIEVKKQATSSEPAAEEINANNPENLSASLDNVDLSDSHVTNDDTNEKHNNDNSDNNSDSHQEDKPVQSVNQSVISIEVQNATVDDVDEVDACANNPIVSLDNIQSEVLLAINSTTGFLDSDPPSISSDPPSTADLDSSPYKSSLGIDSSNSTENLSKGNSTNSSVTDLRTDESHEINRPDNSQSSPTVPQDDDELLNELSQALQSEPPQRMEVANATNNSPNGLKVSPEEILEYQKIKTQLDDLKKLSLGQQDEIKRLRKDLSSTKDEKEGAEKERDSLRKQLENSIGDKQDSIHEAQVKELEITIATQSRDLKLAKEKLTNHDASARKTVSSLQNELKTKVEQLTKMYEDCRKEKDNMVMRYAQAEQKNIELQQKQEKMDAKMKEMLKDKDFVISKFKQLKGDREKAIQAFDARSAELNATRKELEKFKDAYNSSDVKIKWAQNKLKAETTAHQETKTKLDEAMKKIRDSREESEKIRKDFQSMIRSVQETEEVKSTNLDQQLKSATTELKQKQQENAENVEVHSIILKELETLKNKHKDMISELQTWRDKVKCLDTERQHQEETLTRFKETLQTQKVDNENLRLRLNELEDIHDRFVKIQERCTMLQKENEEVLQSNKDVELDMQSCSKREADNLVFTQKISDQNAKLKSEKSALENQVETLTAENERLTKTCQDLDKQVKALSSELSEEKKLRSEETDSLTSKLKEKSQAVEQLSLRVEEALDENKTVKRKQTANIKDLTRQLQQARKKLEAFENKESGGAAGSMGSRTSSSNSLDTVSPQGNHHAEPSGGHLATQHELASPQEEDYPTVRVVEVDKQMLIEKIVRLQRAHARKNEKMEFMEDHINQLLEEIRKKTKIIQMYALREETGALAPEKMDVNKAQMAKKSGVMASLYSLHAQDTAMDLPLSLEINHKLQAVLEDTLLKNITLKDNLETLGTEIARLSKENRGLQLKLQR